MRTLEEIRKNVMPGGMWNPVFDKFYGDSPNTNKIQTERYLGLLEEFKLSYPGEEKAMLFSTPGRSEIIGNHTDHNAGYILAAAISLDIIALAAPTQDGIISVCSKEFGSIKIDTSTLENQKDEEGTSGGMIRGVAARMGQLGYKTGGLNIQTTSTVLQGSGLSSSAAFEVLMVLIISYFYNNNVVTPVEAAQIAQYSENVYFGKPCGLMDQTTCAVGGFVFIDFEDFEKPVVEKIDFDFSKSGYSLAIVDTGGNHADLTEDYTLLENEMKNTASFLGKPVLRHFSAELLLSKLPELRKQGLGDRDILRAFHYFYENKRVLELVDALKNNDMDRFKQLIIESGYSSWMLCQNVYSCKYPQTQGPSIGLVVAEDILKGKGAWRVHGGGFAGTIQAFVPRDLWQDFSSAMEALFGKGAVYKLSIRPSGMYVYQ